MKFEQMQLILEPISIEKLYYSDKVDDDTLAEAMLLNWEDHGSLVGDDESWRLLTELGNNFIFDDVLDEYDTYKSCAYRTLIIKVKDRYFAYYYTDNCYDSECYDWEEVKPIPFVKYEVNYIPINKEVVLFCDATDSYTKLFDKK